MTKLEIFHATIDAHKRVMGAAYAELKFAEAVFKAAEDAEDKVYRDAYKAYKANP